MEEKKIVVKVDVHDDKGKQKALKAVTSLSGINSISMDMKEKTITVIGVVDPIDVLEKLRKHWHTDIVTVGPKEEPKKPDPPKKEEPEKDIDLNHLNHYVFYTQVEDPNGCVIC